MYVPRKQNKRDALLIDAFCGVKEKKRENYRPVPISKEDPTQNMFRTFGKPKRCRLPCSAFIHTSDS